jgi:predicted permease
MDILLKDLRFAARMMWKSKVVTLIAVTSLAVGIGANSAVFSLVNAILLRPRVAANPEQLAEIWVGDPEQPYQTVSYPTYLEFRERNDVFSGLAAYSVARQFKLSGASDVEQVWGEVVSGNYFDVLGVRAERGRGFLPDDDQVPNRNPVVVIGHGLWQRRFGSDPSVIGLTIMLNDQPLTVVGVAPPEYTGMLRGLSSEVWVPSMTLPLLEPSRGEPIVDSRDSRWVTPIGRLAPGKTIAQARAQMELLSARMKAANPDEWRRGEGERARELGVVVLPERETRVHPTMRVAAFGMAGVLLVIVALVLMLACMNLASLLFARAVARRSEIAVRLALGAGRARLVRQLVTESVLLTMFAGVAGVLLAIWGTRALMAYMPALPEGVRLGLEAPMDWRVVLYTLVLAMGTGVLLGLTPALHGTKAALSSMLRDQSSAVTASHRTSRLRASLVTTQVALALVLLIGASLVLRSLENVSPRSLGFRSEHVLVAPIVLDDQTYDRARGHRLYAQLAERVSALPGVEAVSLVDGIPGGLLSRSRSSIEIEGYVPASGESREIDVSVVGPAHFTTLGVPFVAGRDFETRDRDGAPCVAIINEAFARRYFAGAESLGKHLSRGNATGQKEACQIVGVIRDDAWQSLQEEPRPMFALPLFQSQRERMTLMVHVGSAPDALIAAVRESIRAIDPKMPVSDVQTLGSHFDVALYPFRLLAIVIGGCGAMALLLASIGIFGIVAYSVVGREREVGIRLALGARARDILGLVIGQGMVPVAYGIGAGLVLGGVVSFALAQISREIDVPTGVSATDPPTFLGVTALLGVIAFAACYIPARRAVRVDPVVTLRNDG